MILEYRKTSAEILGLTHLRKTTNGDEVYMEKNSSDSFYWQPDTDINQMGMIEDWLIEQGLELDLEYHAGHKQWHIQFGEDIMLSANGSDKSKPIAFMNCFMEWQRKEEG